MKRLLLTLSLISLFGCEESGTNDGYTAGYDLTCGFSWTAGNRFVVDKEFAHKFLAGARVCAREHPERARKVLGLSSEERAVSARGTDEPASPLAEQQQIEQVLTASTPKTVETAEAPGNVANPPVQPTAPLKAEAPAKAKPSAKTKASVKAKTPAKAKPSAKNKAAVQAKTPAKAKPSAKTKASVKAKTPAKAKPSAKAPAKAKPSAKTKASVENRTPAIAVGTPSRNDKTSNSAPETAPRPVTNIPRQQTRQKQPKSSYESFMGE